MDEIVPAPRASVELRVVGSNGTKRDLVVFRGPDPICSGRVDLPSHRSRGLFVQACKAQRPELTSADLHAIADWLQRMALQAGSTPDASESSSHPPVTREQLVEQRDEKADRALAETPSDAVPEAESMLASPELLTTVLADIAQLGVVGETELATILYLIGTSRLLPRPLAAIVQGPSSSGKSYVIDKVVALFPVEAIVKATDLTSNALYYLPEDRLVHAFVVAGERRRGDVDELADATRALREMLSGQELRKVLPTKQGDRMESVEIVRYGPIAFVESTTLTRIFDEDSNRCLPLSTDERAEQTRRVLLEGARRAAGGSASHCERIIAKHQAAQRLLRRVEVTVPFAEQIAERMPSSRPEARRAFELLLAVVRAVALLHQRQRVEGELQHGDTIRATGHDYRVAYFLLLAPLGRALGGDLTPAAERFGQRLRQHWGDREWTAAQAAAADTVVKSVGKAREYAGELAEHGVAEVVEEGRGQKPKVYRIVRDPPPAGAGWLPHPDELDPGGGELPVRDGAAGRQRAHAGGQVDSASGSETRDAPDDPGQDGAAGAATTRRPWSPPIAGGGRTGSPSPTARENGHGPVVAPSPRPTVGDTVRELWPDAEQVADADLRDEHGDAWEGQP